MDKYDVAFPHLGIYIKNLIQTIYVGKFGIAMYGVTIGIAVLCGIYAATYNAKRTGQKEDIYYDCGVRMIIWGFIGARIYYILFSWDYYKYYFTSGQIGKGLFSLIDFRAGGIAIYGGVIGAFTTLFIFCKRKKINPFLLGDTAVPGLILGQAIGRWGNFFNREVFGEYTDSLFAMRLPIEFVRARDISPLQQSMADAAGVNYIQVHPTFLYESVCNLLIFLFLQFYRKRKAFKGELCLLYFGLYGVTRFIIEGVRTDQLLIPHTNIPVSQVVAVALILLCIVGEIACRRMLRLNTLPKYFQISEKERQIYMNNGKGAEEEEKPEEDSKSVTSKKAKDDNKDEEPSSENEDIEETDENEEAEVDAESDDDKSSSED